MQKKNMISAISLARLLNQMCNISTTIRQKCALLLTSNMRPIESFRFISNTIIQCSSADMNDLEKKLENISINDGTQIDGSKKSKENKKAHSKGYNSNI